MVKSDKLKELLLPLSKYFTRKYGTNEKNILVTKWDSCLYKFGNLAYYKITSDHKNVDTFITNSDISYIMSQLLCWGVFSETCLSIKKYGKGFWQKQENPSNTWSTIIWKRSNVTKSKI